MLIVFDTEVAEAKSLTPARLALSVPIVNAHEHPLVAGPVFFSHPLDFQELAGNGSVNTEFAGIAHVGPPSINVEAKIVGVDDATVEKGADPVGEVIESSCEIGSIFGC